MFFTYGEEEEEEEEEEERRRVCCEIKDSRLFISAFYRRLIKY
jgi:hypothetical protein